MTARDPARRARAPALALALLVLLAPACSSRLERALHAPTTGPPQAAAPLKGHLQDGSVVVLDTWSYDDSTRLVHGSGLRLDPQRRPVGTRAMLSVPLDSVALFESNVVHRGMPGAVLAITLLVGVGAVLCITNPKACFGSCPTFYLEAGGGWRLVAESFSNSVLPALEATDVDALPLPTPQGGIVELRMTNEAQETHVVRAVHLVAVPRPPAGRVFAAAGGGFVATTAPVAPSSARAPEGDCLASLGVLDGRERTSPVDSTDLAARETIELEFPAAPEGELGLVLSARQTLLSTFLFYQGLAWLGREAGAWLSRVERTGVHAQTTFAPLQHALGDLAVTVEQEGSAAFAVERTPFETGPIAVDTRIVPLGRSAGRPGAPIRVRLEMVRGHLRLDHVALAGLRGTAEPLRLAPVEVRRGGKADAAALADLVDPGRALVTLPGDTCAIRYRLPAALARTPADSEWFLEGRGYYLEWLRREWLAEEDPRRLEQLVSSPREVLRALAPAYARDEARREEMFWRSRHGSTTP